MLKYLKMSESIAEAMNELGDVEIGRLVRAMILYAWHGQEEQLKGNERILWRAIKNDIERQFGMSEIRKSAAMQRWNPDANECKPMQTDANRCKPMQTDAKFFEKEEEEKNEKEKKAAKEKSKEEKEVGEKEIARDARVCEKPKNAFIPPTVDEIAEYCRERNNGIDPEEFRAFYDSKGWMIGANKMKDWKSAVVTWEKRRGQGKAPSGEPPSFDLDEFYNLALERGKNRGK